MDSNPYAPPATAVEDINTSAQGRTAPPFFAVSGWKLFIMSTFTGGFYSMYWFYQNWKRIKAHENSNIVPAARAIFSLIYCYACLKRIREYGIRCGVAKPPQIGAMTTSWIVTKLMGRLTPPFNLIALASPLFLLPAQDYANKINAQEFPEHDRNNTFRGWNWLAIIVGAFYLAGMLSITLHYIQNGSAGQWL